MRHALLLGLAVGFVAILAGAHSFPWVEHVRLPSKTVVQANGGRLEQLVILLPADRLGSAGTGLRGAQNADDVALPDTLAAEPLLVEHFKVRDADNNVIGIAARHWTVHAGAPATVWSILIPGRGALTLSARGEARAAVEDALARAGYRPGVAWSGDVRLPVATDGALVFGNREFADLEGSYSETWRITGVGETGELRGTIELATITQRGA